MLDDYEELEKESESFDSSYRCDRCGAQAYTKATHEGMVSELLFCYHHSKEHRAKMRDEGWKIYDDGEALDNLFDHKEIPVA